MSSMRVVFGLRGMMPLRRFRLSVMGSAVMTETKDMASPEIELKSSFLKEFVGRGYLHQCTDLENLDEAMSKGPVSTYLGFDATADSLHVGSLLQIMILRLLQKHGHNCIVLVGGGTTKVGDPSGKDEARKLLNEEAIQSNIAGISRIFSQFLDMDKAKLVNNADWLDDLKYIQFLREFGPFFSVNRMLTLDSVKNRLEREQALSFLEFNYMILQAYDFIELARRENVRLQLGGSDQWGNIINGVELGRRIDNMKLFGLTAPLVTTADGRKMGKTADGAIWLTAEKLPPYDYWQFWRNVVDADVQRFLKMFTDLEIDEIEALDLTQAPAINAAKRKLADHATTLAHGAHVLPEIHATVDTLFACASSNFNDATSLPRLELSKQVDFQDTDAILVVDLLTRLDFAQSKSQAKRLIQGGGARIQDKKVSDVFATVALTDLQDAPDQTLKLSSGKKKHGLICLLP